MITSESSLTGNNETDIQILKLKCDALQKELKEVSDVLSEQIEILRRDLNRSIDVAVFNLEKKLVQKMSEPKSSLEVDNSKKEVINKVVNKSWREVAAEWLLKNKK